MEHHKTIAVSMLYAPTLDLKLIPVRVRKDIVEMEKSVKVRKTDLQKKIFPAFLKYQNV